MAVSQAGSARAVDPIRGILLKIVSIVVFVFDEVVTGTTLTGGLVVATGVFIIYREHRLGIRRRKARKVSPPSS